MFLQLIDIIETVYRGASKGRGLVVSPKGMSLRLCRAMSVGLISCCRLLDPLPLLSYCQRHCLSLRVRLRSVIVLLWNPDHVFYPRAQFMLTSHDESCPRETAYCALHCGEDLPRYVDWPSNTT